MPPRATASLQDGTPVDLQTRKGPWYATVRGGINRVGDQVQIRASNRAEYEKLLARVKRDIEDEGGVFTDPGEPTEAEDSGPVTIQVQLDGVVYLREMAKITLGCLSLVLDESWLDTDDAEKYRGWLWGDNPVNDDGSPALGFPVSPTPVDEHFLNPPEHLLFFSPTQTSGRIVLSVAFFSTVLRAGVDIGDLVMPLNAWHTAPGAPPTQTTFGALVTEAAVKSVEVANASAAQVRNDEPGAAEPAE